MTLYVYAYRDPNESDTASTDSDATCGGLGTFEYGQKAFPHALMHFSELVQIFGHHGACCTCVGEAGHKLDIKSAAQFARTYGDKNQSQDGMLQYVLRQELWHAVLECLEVDESVELARNDSADASPALASPALVNLPTIINTLSKLREPLPCSVTSSWSNMPPPRRDRPATTWGSTFISSRVLVTRNELLTLLRSKLSMHPTWDNILRLTNLFWEFFGVVELGTDDNRRKFVGVSTHSPGRRDFVRLAGSEDNTELSAQVIMFVRITGFVTAGIEVPESLRLPLNNTCTENSIVLCLVRWLSPHRLALERDSRLRPLCPPPFDVNHSLWTFTKRRRRRPYFSDGIFARQLHLFPGSNAVERRRNASDRVYASYDFVTLESINSYMNCTSVVDDGDCIMETITLPF